MADLYPLLRRLAFLLDPEVSHGLALGALGLLERAHPLEKCLTERMRDTLPARPVKAMGIHFPNPVGLAAGLDKDARAVAGLAGLGFGFLELGTVTPLPQAGNPRPRLFRLTGAQALVNRMGFNSVGLNQFLANLARHNQQVRVGINIGKNAQTPLEQAAHDYLTCLRAVYTAADYVAVNISSPNTPGLRDLQEREGLNQLLGQLKDGQARLADLHDRYTPIAVKIAPDLEPDAIGRIAEALASHGIDGVIATNTTLTRPGNAASYPGSEQSGGLSGAPLAAQSSEVIRILSDTLGDTLPIIGVGGIVDVASAQEKFAAGATLIQLYTGLIYRGPVLIREILEGLPATTAR